MILRTTTTPFILHSTLHTHLLRLSGTITAHLLDISHRAVLAHTLAVTLVAFLTFNRLIAIIGPFLPISTESEGDASQRPTRTRLAPARSLGWCVVSLEAVPLLYLFTESESLILVFAPP